MDEREVGDGPAPDPLARHGSVSVSQKHLFETQPGFRLELSERTERHFAPIRESESGLTVGNRMLEVLPDSLVAISSPIRCLSSDHPGRHVSREVIRCDPVQPRLVGVVRSLPPGFGLWIVVPGGDPPGYGREQLKRTITMANSHEWFTAFDPASRVIEEHFRFVADQTDEHRMNTDLDRSVRHHPAPGESVLQEHAARNWPDYVLEPCGPCRCASLQLT